jgi:hypothetical protein|tara:strand:+ start:823 stop:1674 length:852 start_codon:yes stop_codon:yes gene_type:complete
MSLKKVIREFYHEKKLQEGFDPEGNPDLKYYAFDWDDNIATMPTQIILLSDEDKEVGMSTEDFADYRGMIGKEPFDYKSKMIVGYADDPYRNFGVQGDNAFIVDSLLAKPGPSWNDFVEAINGGSIFSIITARGHTPSVLREAIYNMIVTNHNGISKESLIDNLKKYRNMTGDEEKDSSIMINDYLDLNRYYPVTYGEGNAADPEEGKIKALREFITYVREMSQMIGKKAFLKNDIKNNFVPMIGFSDDDPGNVEKIKAFLDKEYKDKPVKMYLTKGGDKKEV